MTSLNTNQSGMQKKPLHAKMPFISPSKSLICILLSYTLQINGKEI